MEGKVERGQERNIQGKEDGIDGCFEAYWMFDTNTNKSDKICETNLFFYLFSFKLGNE